MLIDQIYNKTQTRKKTNKTEKHSRSLAKAISWRIIGTLDTILISWVISGQVTVAVSIGVFELLTKTLLYYFHERMWTSIKWGK